MDSNWFKDLFLDEAKAALDANSGGGIIGVEPAEDDIPKVFFGAALPQTKDDTIMSFRYISKTTDISGYCKTKAQGNASMGYPKKNQTVKLYKDVECTEKLKVDFKGWGKQNKFCFKANWLDLTHARNIVSARLWGDVVRSRSDYAELPEELRNSPNQGAIDGFPVKVYADGVYQGRYTINIPKDAWMANMDDELDEHCILCGENYVSGCFRAEALIDGSDWTDEIHDTVPESIKTRWNEAINFVMNSTDEEFVAGIGEYFDVTSLIDYLLAGSVICNLDGFGKNQLYETYDGMKWFATMYDLDSTWGMWWEGNRFVNFSYSRYQFQDYVDSPHKSGNLLYVRVAKLFEEEIKARWNELKNGVLSVGHIINCFERFTDIAPLPLIAEDYADTTANGSFTGIQLKDENTIQQLRKFAHDRLIYTESCFNEVGNSEGGELVYSLPETVFDGSSGLDTGVHLCDMDEYTVLVDYQAEDGVDTGSTLLDYWNIVDGVRLGWRFNLGSPVGTGAFFTPGQGTWEFWANRDGEFTERHKLVLRKTRSGIYTAFSEKYGIRGISPSYFANENGMNKNLLIGCCDNSTTNRLKGTVYSCKVYNYAMSDADIVEFVQS